MEVQKTKKRKSFPKKEITSSTNDASLLAAPDFEPVRKAYEPKEYELDSGTIVNRGLEYETIMLALLSLNCLNGKDEKIWMASNPKGVPGFDDIVLHKQLADGTSVTLLVQLKHKESAEKLTEQDFFKKGSKKKSHPFYLVKYVEHYVNLTGQIYNPENDSEIIKHLREAPSLKFILFTNKGVQEYDFLEDLKDVNVNVLNVSDFGKVFKFDYDKLLCNSVLNRNSEFQSLLDNKQFFDDLCVNFQIMQADKFNLNNKEIFRNMHLFCKEMAKDDPEKKMHLHNRYFFDHFSLVCDQIHAEDGNKLITQKLMQLLKSDGLSSLDFQQIVKKYLEFIETWAQGEIGGNYPLSEVHISSHLLTLTLENFMVKFNTFSYPVDDNFDVTTWSEMISDVGLTLIISETKVYKFLEYYVSYEIGQKLAKYKFGKNVLWDDKEFQLQSQELNQNIRRFIPQQNKTTLLNIYKFLWVEGHLPLVLKVDQVQDYELILNALRVARNSLKVIIVNKTGSALPQDDTAKQVRALRDIRPEYRNKLMSRSIKLQGRSSILFNKLIDNNLSQYVTTNDIIAILSEDFNIGNILEPMSGTFIKRSVSKIYLNPEVLKNVPDELFLIEGLNIDNFNNLQDYKSQNKIAHHVRFHSNTKLEWIRSYGSIRQIERYRLETAETDFSEDLFHFNDTTTILSTIPGMGKTILMDYLAYSAPTDTWALKIDLNKYTKYYQSSKRKKLNILEHLTFFNDEILTKHGCKNPLAQKIFQTLLAAKKVLILLDGFDEVSYSYKSEVTLLVKALRKEDYRMWITTRPHMRIHLEEELCSLSVSLKPFSEEDQKLFLTKCFNQNIKENGAKSKELVAKFSDELIEATKYNMNDRDSEFAGIPLQVSLLAFAFEEDCKNYVSNTASTFNKRFDLLFLYQNFIEKKIKVLCDKFGEKAEDSYIMFENHYSLFALRLLFKCDEFKIMCEDLYNSFYKVQPKNIQLLQRSGLVTVDQDFNVNFVHRTFAEYLSAKWLSENFNNEENRMMKKGARLALNKRFKWKKNFLFNIFDRIMAEGHPAHLSIINGHFGTEEIFKSSKVDKLDRSLLHVIAVYGNFNPSHTLREHLIHLNSDNLSNVLEDILNIEDINMNQRDKFGYTALDYALASGSMNIAEKLCSKPNLKLINIRVCSESLELREKYLLYCCMMGYNNLFKALIKFFAFYDMVSKSTEIDENVCSYVNTFINDLFIADHKDRIQKNLQSFLSEFKKMKVSDLFRSSTTEYEDLRLAVIFGTTENVKRLIDEGADVNEQGIFLATPLHYAAEFGKSEIAKLLLSNGAQINKTTDMGETALYLAVFNKHLDVIPVLLHNNIDISITTNWDETALETAEAIKDSRIISLLRKYDNTTVNKTGKENYPSINIGSKIIDTLINHMNTQIGKHKSKTTMHGAVLDGDLVTLKLLKNGVNELDHNGDTILHIAIRNENMEIVQFLLQESSIEPNLQNLKSETPLHVAVDKKNVEIVKLLLNYCLKVLNLNLSDMVGNTALHYAALNGSEEIACLLASKAEVNKVNNARETPLVSAITARQVAIAKLLLLHGADINMVDKHENTILHTAVDMHCDEIIPNILALEFDINKPNVIHNTPLHVAVKDNRLNTAKLLYEHGADIRTVDLDENSLLHVAAVNGSQEMISWLLLLGVEVNRKNLNNVTPLHFAVKQINANAAKLLHSHGADVNCVAPKGDTILHLAVRNGSGDLITWSLIAGVDVNKQNDVGNTALHDALRQGNMDVAKLLHQQGADVNILGYDGYSALHSAAVNGSERTISWLLSLGADVNQPSSSHETPLHTALRGGHTNAAVLMHSHGADIHLKGFGGCSAVHCAAESGSEKIISWLVSLGLTVNAQDGQNDTPLHIAVRKGFVGAAKLLYSYGADMDLPGVLHSAAESGSEELITWCLSMHADINARDVQNDTPLHVSIRAGHINASQLLSSRGSDVNMLGFNGDSILHCATVKGDVELFSWCLSSFPEINKRNSYNNTPLHSAVLQGNLDLARLLRSHGAATDMRGFNGSTLLHFAAENGSEDLISWILGLGLGVDDRDEEDDTPLHVAIRKGNLTASQLLVSHGADSCAVGFNGATILHCAAKSGDQEVISWCLSLGAEVNKQNNRNNTPLLVAVAKGHFGASKLLYSSGADIHINGYLHATAMHCAAQSGSEEIISWLYSLEVDINRQNEEDDTPLHFAVKNHHLGAATLLHSLGADIHLCGFKGRTLLYSAAESGSEEMVSWCLSLGLDINAQDEFHETPLHAAVRNCHIGVSKLLFLNRADVNIPGFRKSTVLHCAVEKGNLDLISWCLAINMDVSKTDEQDNTPLHVAVIQNDIEAAKLLHSFGANPIVRGYNGTTLMHCAAENGSERMIAWLLSLNISVNDENACNDTPIQAAVLGCHLDAAKLLYSNGADVKKVGFNGDTLLHCAVEGNSVDLIAWCLSLGMDVDKRNNQNNTPLFKAAMWGNLQVAKLLCEHGADTNVLGLNGGTLLHAAAYSGSEETILWALSTGVEVNKTNQDSATPLHLAVLKNHLSAAKLLHSHGADVAVADCNQSTPLHTASLHGHSEIVVWLLSLDTEVNKQNKFGLTPLHYAISAKHDHVAKILLGFGADAMGNTAENGTTQS